LGCVCLSSANVVDIFIIASRPREYIYRDGNLRSQESLPQEKGNTGGIYGFTSTVHNMKEALEYQIIDTTHRHHRNNKCVRLFK
jgi:hypothetical protein